MDGRGGEGVSFHSNRNSGDFAGRNRLSKSGGFDFPLERNKTVVIAVLLGFIPHLDIDIATRAPEPGPVVP